MPGKWMNELMLSLDKNISLETTDGVVRKGKMTGYRTQKILFNNDEVHYIVDIELNGDSDDRIELIRINKMKVY